MTEKATLLRLQRIEDRQALRDLVSRYSLHVDNHDFTALSRLWHPAATYGWHGAAPVAEGAQAIAALLESRISPNGPSFHVNHEQIVDWDEPAPGEDAQTASGIVFSHVESSVRGQQYQAAIRYHDRYVRHEGRWLFAARQLAFLYSVPTTAYGSILLEEERMRSDAGSGPAHWPRFA